MWLLTTHSTCTRICCPSAVITRLTAVCNVQWETEIVNYCMTIPLSLHWLVIESRLHPVHTSGSWQTAAAVAMCTFQTAAWADTCTNSKVRVIIQITWFSEEDLHNHTTEGDRCPPAHFLNVQWRKQDTQVQLFGTSNSWEPDGNCMHFTWNHQCKDETVAIREGYPHTDIPRYLPSHSWFYRILAYVAGTAGSVPYRKGPCIQGVSR